MIRPGSGIILDTSGAGSPLGFGGGGVPVTMEADYDGTGANAYLFDLSSFPLPDTSQSPYYGPSIGNIYVKDMPIGVYQYDLYVGYLGSAPSDTSVCGMPGNEYYATGTLITDTSGILGNPGEPQLLCKITSTIVVTNPGASLEVSKAVRNASVGGDFTASESGENYAVAATAGEQVQFRVRVANTGAATLATPVVYDILPYVGDVGVLPENAGVSRGSTKEGVLSGVTIPAGWTAEYATVSDPCRPELTLGALPPGYSCTTATWLPIDAATSTTDLAAARALKFTGPTAYGVASVSDLILDFQVPADWASGDQSWNIAAGTAAYGSGMMAAVATPKVGLRFPGTSISWQKTDAAGVPLAGATFLVTGPGGYSQSVTDNVAPDGDPADGAFRIDNLPPAGVTLPAEFTITETAAPPGYAINPTALTAEVTNSNVGTDIGSGTVVDQLAVEVFVQKLARGSNQPVPGSQWRVLADFNGLAGAAADGVTVTESPGEAGTFHITGLAANTPYWLQEATAPSGFSLLAEAVQFTLDDAGAVTLGSGAGSGAEATVSAAASTDPAQSPWWVISVRDVPVLTLPATGGPGEAIFQAFGLAIAIAGVLWFWRVRQRRRSQQALVGIPLTR